MKKVFAPPLTYRHEYKYEIHPAEDIILSHRLRAVLRHDSHAEDDGSYQVNSLYFDTPNDKALREKIDGINKREKFRLRFYGQNPDYIRLERKLKINGLCAKQSALITQEEAEKLIAGTCDFLLSRKETICHDFYRKTKSQQLKAAKIVCYDREAFVFEPGNVRVTLDRNLRISNNPRSFFSAARYDWQAGEGTAVLEVKYDEFLPAIVRSAVQTPSLIHSAYSKYALSRRYD